MNEWAKKMLVQHLEEIFFVGFLFYYHPLKPCLILVVKKSVLISCCAVGHSENE